MDTFSAFDRQSPYQVWKGVVARAVRGDRITLALVDLEPGAVVSEHQHENEQLGFVVLGEMKMTIGGTARELEPGDTYVIPGNVPHDAVAGPEGCTVVDVFSPPRADWEKLDRLEPAPGRWPASS